MKTFYTNAKIFRNGRFEPGLIAVEGGRIAAAGEPRPGDRVVDLGGRHLVPGLVDVHVHLREPGFPQKIQKVLKLFFRLPRESRNKGRTDRDVGAQCPPGGNTLEILFSACRPLHRF